MPSLSQLHRTKSSLLRWQLGEHSLVSRYTLPSVIPHHVFGWTVVQQSHKELSFAGTNKNVLLSQKKRRRKGTQGKGYLLWNAALLPTWGLDSEGHEPKREEVHIAPAESLVMCSWATLFAFSRIVQIARLSASSVLVNQWLVRSYILRNETAKCLELFS
jgi:hypothetical protein